MMNTNFRTSILDLLDYSVVTVIYNFQEKNNKSNVL